MRWTDPVSGCFLEYKAKLVHMFKQRAAMDVALIELCTTGAALPVIFYQCDMEPVPACMQQPFFSPPRRPVVVCVQGPWTQTERTVTDAWGGLHAMLCGQPFTVREWVFGTGVVVWGVCHLKRSESACGSGLQIWRACRKKLVYTGLQEQGSSVSRRCGQWVRGRRTH